MKDETVVALFGIGCSTFLGALALIQRMDTAVFIGVGSVIGGIVAYAYQKKKERGSSGTTKNIP